MKHKATAKGQKILAPKQSFNFAKPVTYASTPTHPLVHPRAKLSSQRVGQFLQPKLKIGQPNDKYEQEADRVTNWIVNMPEQNIQQKNGDPLDMRFRSSQLSKNRNRILRMSRFQIRTEVWRNTEQDSDNFRDIKQCPCEGDCPRCSPDKNQTRQSEYNVSSRDLHALNYQGSPLPKSERDFFESRLGQDLGQVRVHHHPHASSLAEGLHAKAFTHHNHIVFKSGQYQPGLQTGKQLIAHELTHAIQQGQAKHKGRIRIQSVSSEQATPMIQRAPATTAVVPSKPRSKPFSVLSISEGDEEKVTAFSKSDPAQWDYKVLIDSLDILWEVQEIARRLNYLLKNRKSHLNRILKAKLHHDIRQKVRPPKTSSPGKTSSPIFIKHKRGPSWGAMINALVHDADFIQDLISGYDQSGSQLSLGEWLNNKLYFMYHGGRKSRRKIRWRLRYVLSRLPKQNWNVFQENVDYNALKSIIDQVVEYKRLPKRLSNFTDILSQRIRYRGRIFRNWEKFTKMEVANLDFSAIRMMIKIYRDAKETLKTRRKPWLRKSLGRFSYYLPKLETLLAPFYGKRIKEAKYAYRVLKSYLWALRILPDRHARRAAIEHQKNLTTTNILYKWKTTPSFDPVNYMVREEGGQGGALAMLRWLNALVIRILAPKLRKTVKFGFKRPGVLTYTSYTKSDRFKHPGKGSPKKFRRSFGSHDYGALDIVGRAGTQIKLHLRKTVNLDELPESHHYIPGNYPAQHRKLKLTKAKVNTKRTAKTYETIDLANKLLKSFKYRGGKMVGIKKLTRFWSALTFRNVSKWRPWADWKRTGRGETGRMLDIMRHIYAYLRKIFLKIAKDAGITSQIARRRVDVSSGYPDASELKRAYGILFKNIIGPQSQILDLTLKHGKRRHRFALYYFLRRNKISESYIIINFNKFNDLLTNYIKTRNWFMLTQFINEVYKATGNKRKWKVYFNLAMYLPTIRVMTERLEREVKKWKKESGIYTSNHVRISLEYTGPELFGHNRYGVKGGLYLTHMYSLSPDILRATINVKNPEIDIGKVGTTGSSFVPHIHYGAYSVLQDITTIPVDLLDVPCSPLVYLADKVKQRNGVRSL